MQLPADTFQMDSDCPTTKEASGRHVPSEQARTKKPANKFGGS